MAGRECTTFTHTVALAGGDLQLRFGEQAPMLCTELTYIGASSAAWFGFGFGTSMIGSTPVTVGVTAGAAVGPQPKRVTAETAAGVSDTSGYSIVLPSPAAVYANGNLTGSWGRADGYTAGTPVSVVWARSDRGGGGINEYHGGGLTERGVACLDATAGTVDLNGPCPPMTTGTTGTTGAASSGGAATTAAASGSPSSPPPPPPPPSGSSVPSTTATSVSGEAQVPEDSGASPSATPVAAVAAAAAAATAAAAAL